MKTLGKPKPVKEKKRKVGVKKSSSRGLLIKEIHSVMRDIVIERDGGCVVSYAPEKGHTKIIQAGHIVASTKGSVRFDLRNVHAQCSGCNGRHVHFPHYYIDWFIRKFGADTYLDIVSESNVVSTMKTYELQELMVQMKRIREKQLVCNLSGEPFKPYFTQKEILSGAWSK